MLPSVAAVTTSPKRSILAVVTVGRATCAAPILEICRILHTRGHRIEFACLEGWQKLAAPHDWIAQTHTVGRDLTDAEDEHLYRVLDASGIGTHDARVKMFQGFDLLFSWWTETYANIKRLCQDTQPDFIFADELADAAMDVARELNIPFAGMAPQLPPWGIPVDYITGSPGYQLRHLINEHAGLWARIREELNHIQLRLAMRAANFGAQTALMRRAAGYIPKPPGGSSGKPDHLFLVNSFFGLEVPRDLPPLVRPVGPVLADTYPPLSTSPEAAAFLATRKRVLYMAFGTHIVHPAERISRVVAGIAAALDAGLIDGVIWARKPVHGSAETYQPQPQSSPSPSTAASLAHSTPDNPNHPAWLTLPWTPQRAILSHPSTTLYLTHCGGSSTVEAAYHGVPVLALPGYGDQLGHAMRLEAAGVGVRLDRNLSTSADITAAIAKVVGDEDGGFSRNVLRLRRLASVNSERKGLAAQMVEEVMWDHELRFTEPAQGREWDGGGRGGADSGSSGEKKKKKGSFAHGKELRPPHLETADMRIPRSWRMDVAMAVARLVLYPPLLAVAYVCEALGVGRMVS